MRNNEIHIDLIKGHQWKDFFYLEYSLMRKYNEGHMDLTEEMAIDGIKRILHKKHNIKKPPHYIWVATKDDKYAGHVWGYISPIQLISKRYKLTIIDFIVYPRHRRQGVGSALLKYVNNFCKDMRISKVDCQTKIGDKMSNQFYRKRGFKVDGYVYRFDIDQ